MDKTKKPVNDIRVSFNSRIGGIVSYCEKLLKENNLRELNFSAVGGSIGTLVSVVEILKTITPGLYQVNRLATISYQSVEEGGKSEAQNQRLYPKLEVKLLWINQRKLLKDSKINYKRMRENHYLQPMKKEKMKEDKDDSL